MVAVVHQFWKIQISILIKCFHVLILTNNNSDIHLIYILYVILTENALQQITKKYIYET